MQLRGANALLTGASRGIGAHLAEGLAARGVNLALVARSEEELEEVARSARAHGVTAVAIPADVTKKAGLKRVVSTTAQELGPLDLLVNNAGTDRVAHFATLDPQVIEDLISLNLVAPELLTRMVLPQMIERRRGHIVNMASMAGKIAVPHMAVYSSTKRGLVGFSWALRAELKPYGIGVSVICPGFVKAGVFLSWNPSGETPRIARAVSAQDVVDATIEAIEKNKGDVDVIGGLGKLGGLAHVVALDAAMGITRRGGLFSFMRRFASQQTPEP